MKVSWGNAAHGDDAGMATPVANAPHGLSAGDLARALWRRWVWILAPVLIVAVLAYGYLINATLRYTSQVQILVEDTQSIFARAERENNNGAGQADPATIASHVQLLLARDLARAVIAELKLTQYAEFDPLKEGISIPARVLIMLGLAPDPRRMSAEERALNAFAGKLTVYQVDNSRVISALFTSSDPERAADIINAVGERYIQLQQDAKRQSTLQAATWLGAQIEEMRKKVEEAEARVEAFRSTNDLLRGSASATLPSSQLSELNTRLTVLNTQHAEAKARAGMIRDSLKKGGDLAALSDVLNSAVIQRLSEQRVTLQRRIAELSSTLLPQHPRMRELNAELADLRRQIAGEAEKVVKSLDSEAGIAAAREKAVRASLEQMKGESERANSSEVELRSFERDAAAQRQILETFLARHREATARQANQALPVEARIISRGAVSNEPSHPKKAQIFLIAVLATLLVSVSTVLSIALMEAAAEENGAPALRPMAIGEDMEHHGLRSAAFAGRAGRDPAPAPHEHPFPMAARDAAAALLARRQGAESLRVLVTSPQRMSQNNFAAVNLARLLTSEGCRVIVIDANMRSPRLDRQLGLKDARGLAELMQGQCSFAEVIQRDGQSPVHAIAPGGNRGTLVTLFEAERLERVLDALEGAYDIIIIDAPPVLLTGEAQMLGGHVDAAVILRDELPGGSSLDARAAAGLTLNGERAIDIVMAAGALADADGNSPEPVRKAAA